MKKTIRGWCANFKIPAAALPSIHSGPNSCANCTELSVSPPPSFPLQWRCWCGSGGSQGSKLPAVLHRPLLPLHHSIGIARLTKHFDDKLVCSAVIRVPTTRHQTDVDHRRGDCVRAVKQLSNHPSAVASSDCDYESEAAETSLGGGACGRGRSWALSSPLVAVARQ